MPATPVLARVSGEKENKWSSLLNWAIPRRKRDPHFYQDDARPYELPTKRSKHDHDYNDHNHTQRFKLSD